MGPLELTKYMGPLEFTTYMGPTGVHKNTWGLLEITKYMLHVTWCHLNSQHTCEMGPLELTQYMGQLEFASIHGATGLHKLRVTWGHVISQNTRGHLNSHKYMGPLEFTKTFMGPA